MLVTAIPVTVVFGLIEGQYPSQVLQLISPFTPGTSNAAAAVLLDWAKEHLATSKLPVP